MEQPPTCLLPERNLHLWWTQMSAIKSSRSQSMWHQYSSKWDAFSTTHQLWAAVVWYFCFKATVIWSRCTGCSTADRVPNITILFSATLNKKNVTWTRARLSRVSRYCMIPNGICSYEPAWRLLTSHNRCEHNWKLIFFLSPVTTPRVSKYCMILYSICSYEPAWCLLTSLTHTTPL